MKWDGLYSRIQGEGNISLGLFLRGQEFGERTVESEQITTSSEDSLGFLSTSFIASSLN